MGMHGNAWECMDKAGEPGDAMEMYGRGRGARGCHGNVWTRPGRPWKAMDKAREAMEMMEIQGQGQGGQGRPGQVMEGRGRPREVMCDYGYAIGGALYEVHSRCIV